MIDIESQGSLAHRCSCHEVLSMFPSKN